MKPKISFILPTFNRVNFVGECIKSLLNQNMKEIEVIVVDDCSTDTTPILMKWFCQQDDRVVYLRNKKNLGAGLSRNKGNEIAKADIICVCDSDDVYPQGRAKFTYNYFKKHSRIDIMNSSYRRIDYSNNAQQDFVVGKIDKKKFKSGNYYFCHPSCAYRRKDIIKYPYSKETKTETDDYKMVRNFLDKGKIIKGVKPILCYHRVLPNSMMSEMRGGSLQ